MGRDFKSWRLLSIGGFDTWVEEMTEHRDGTSGYRKVSGDVSCTKSDDGHTMTVTSEDGTVVDFVFKAVDERTMTSMEDDPMKVSPGTPPDPGAPKIEVTWTRVIP